MKKHVFLVIIIVLSGVSLLYVYFQRSSDPNLDLRGVNKETPKEPQHLHSGLPTPADEERTSQILAHENGKLNVPINFYGKVVDQDGIPLPGASVYYDVLGLRFIPGANFDPSFKKEGQIPTGSDGTFFIGGITATSLSISKIEKAGYRQSKAIGGTFGYAGNPNPFQSDSKAPVTFIMFKEEALVVLIHYDKTLKFAWDGQPKLFDIMSGLPSVGGIIEIIPKRSSIPRDKFRNFDWSLQIRILGGGIVQSGNEHGFLAPKSGYLPSLTFGTGPHDLLMHNSNGVTLYVKLPDNTFARFLLSVYPSNKENSFGAVLEGFVNPNVGSRVLEYVPSLKLLSK